MKSLILVLTLLAASPTFAAQNYECRATSVDETGNKTELVFTNESAFIGDAAFKNLNGTLALTQGVHHFQSYSADLRMSLAVITKRVTQKSLRNGKRIRSSNVIVKAQVDDQTWNFEGKCVEQL